MNSTIIEDRFNFFSQKLQNLFDCPINDLKLESESKIYDAAYFKINELKFQYRKAKTTPVKSGQFVTFWKRNTAKIIEPFNASDEFDAFIIKVGNAEMQGIFIFPKSLLIEKEIISTISTEGKRALRVYPFWEKKLNNMAQKTQLWQLDFFIEISDESKISFDIINLIINQKLQN